MDFTNTTERLLLETIFWNWVQADVTGIGREDLTEWYQAFMGLPKNDALVIRFGAFAAGVIAGMDLAETYRQMERVALPESSVAPEA